MSRDTVLLIAIALGRLLVHMLTNAHYGFHRDGSSRDSILNLRLSH